MKKFENILNKLEEYMAGLLVLLMTVLIFIQVFFRYILNSPLSWSEELARLCLVWLGFMGSVIALRKGEHIYIGNITKKLSLHKKLIYEIFSYVIIGIILIFLLIFGLDLVKEQYISTTPALEIYYAWFTIPVPLSACLMLIHICFSIYERIIQISKRGE